VSSESPTIKYFAYIDYHQWVIIAHSKNNNRNLVAVMNHSPTKRAQMKGEVKSADELSIKWLHVAQESEKTAAPHYHF